MEDGHKMTPLDDEFISEEARKCAIDVRDNIAKLIRIFSDKEENMKLAAFANVKSVEFSAFIDGFLNMQKLY